MAYVAVGSHMEERRLLYWLRVKRGGDKGARADENKGFETFGRAEETTRVVLVGHAQKRRLDMQDVICGTFPVIKQPGVTRLKRVKTPNQLHISMLGR